MKLRLITPTLEDILAPVLQAKGIAWERLNPQHDRLTEGDILLIQDPIWIDDQPCHVYEIWQRYLQRDAAPKNVYLLKIGPFSLGSAHIPWVGLLDFEEKIPDILNRTVATSPTARKFNSFCNQLVQGLKGHGGPSFFDKAAKLGVMFEVVESTLGEEQQAQAGSQALLVSSLGEMEAFVERYRAYAHHFAHLPYHWQLTDVALIVAALTGFIAAQDKSSYIWAGKEMAAKIHDLLQQLYEIKQYLLA